MKNGKKTGRHQNIKRKNRMKRPAVTVLALMLSTSSFGTVTAYADEVDTVTESGQSVNQDNRPVDQNNQAGDQNNQPEEQNTQSGDQNNQSGDQNNQPEGQDTQTVDQSTQSEEQNNQAGDQNDQPEGQDSQLEGQDNQTAEQNNQSEDQSIQPVAQGEDDQIQQNDSPTNPYDAIERPKQSDTVETIPGKPSDTQKDETGTEAEEITDSSSVVTDTKPEPEADTGEAGQAGSSDGTDGSTKAAENSLGGESDETQETEDESTTPLEEAKSTAETEKNYDYFYDEETGKFNVTFNIKEDANGDQTVELSKVLEEIRAAGKSEFENWRATPEGSREFEEAEEKYKKDKKYSSLKKTFNGVPYSYDMSSGDVNLYVEPGCTTVFDVYITNGSNHTYVYKDQSFTVATPDMTNDEHTGVIGFDGQELPKDHSETKLSLGFNRDPDDENAMNHLVDEALKEDPNNSHIDYMCVDADGHLTTEKIKYTFPAGTQLEKKGNYYYVVGNGCYYGRFYSSGSDVITNAAGAYVLKNEKRVITYYYNSKFQPETYTKQYGRCDSLMVGEVQSAVNKYMQAHDYTYESYILEYYNNRDNTQYQTINELVQNNEDVLKELGFYTLNFFEKDENGKDKPIEIDIEVPNKYNDFYKNILSFNVGDSDEMQKFLEEYKTNEKDGHDDGYWSHAGTNLTIGDYMADKLNKTDGAWEKANEYFNALTASGITKEEATWVAFTMATNIDGRLANNDYQNTEWLWYSSLVLKQQDGTLNLTKVDTDDHHLGDDEGEGQTSFYLWTVDKKTETAADGTQKTTDVTKYCVYVDPVYETVKNDDGTEDKKLVKDGYYGWVEYDPENKALNYTITTTNGTLNIDYALLEGMVYYLQEKAAPDGYDVDSKIYVICDESAYKQMTEEKGVSSVVNPATGVESATVYLGAIKGNETLKVKFINRKTVVVPDPDPTPDPTPTPGTEESHYITINITEDEAGEVLGAVRPLEVQEETQPEITAEPGKVLGAERLPKTGDTGEDVPAVLFGFGIIAALYAWISGKRDRADKLD